MHLMTTIITLFFITCFTYQANAQVTVAGSGGAANGSYATLKLAFDALNLVNSQSGNVITVTITADITDNNSAVLNQPSVSSWTSLTISPSGTRILSGNISAPMIDLNGADNVTINGLNSSGNALTFSNTSQSNSTGTSTVRLINDATNNTITNCTLLGSTLSAPMQVGLNTIPSAATVLISTSNGTAGNDNNTISNNTIAEAGSNLPIVAICSAGQSISVSNDNCIITGNKIANFYGASGANGIAIASNSTSFTITSNKLYQTVSRSGLSSDRYLDHIVINTPSGGGYMINNNTIGYADENGNGMLTNTGGRFSGIDLIAVAATPLTEIQGNTINGINWTSNFNMASAYAFGAFNAYAVRAGGVNFGTTTGNILGATSGTGTPTSNIYINQSVSTITACMLYLSSTTSCVIANNLMGAITMGASTFYLYGIVVENTGSHSILSNTIGNSTPGNISMGYNESGVAYFRGIYSTATGNITIGSNGQGNIIQNVSFNCSSYNEFFGIQHLSTVPSLNVNYNTIQGISFASVNNTNNTFTAISNTGYTLNEANFNFNQLGTSTSGLASYATTFNVTGNLTGITSGNISPTSTLSISNNSVRGINFSGSGSGLHKYIIWTNAGTVTTNINNNSFTNLNVKAAQVVFLARSGNMSSSAIENINGNAIVNGFTKAGGNGEVYFFQAFGSSGITSTMNNLNNNFSGVSILDQSILSGWQNSEGSASGGPIKNISGNIFDNLTGSLTNGAVTGLYVNYYGPGSIVSNNSFQHYTCIGGILPLRCYNFSSVSGSLSILNNTILDINSNTGPQLYGIEVRGHSAIISKNKIVDLQSGAAAASVRGIFIDQPFISGTVNEISNNLIGHLSTPLATGNNAVTGIYIYAPVSSTFNVDYNTIYLAASGGNGFGSSGIYHEASTTAANGTLYLRNNIIANLSTPGTGGLTIAFRRSNGGSSMLNNYASTSNNNLFYAGTPDASHLIYYDGTSSAMTLNAFKGALFSAGVVAPRDAFSVTEPINTATFFLSTTGSNPNFLHLDPTNPTQAESGGQPLSYINDFDGDIRNMTTPDIGADEGAFTFNDLLGPTISYTPITKGNVSNSQSFTNVIITDISNVEGSAGIRPRIYYKRSTDVNVFNDNTNVTAGWKYAEANTSTSPFDFTIDYTLLSGGGGLAVGNTVQYFVVAQDQHAPVNLGIESGVFNIEPTTVVLPNTAFPITGNIKSFPIVNSLSGTYTIPGNYPTLTGAGGAFEAINSNVVTGNINLQITANNGSENGLISLNEFAAPFTINIYPTGAARFLAGASNSGGILKLNGADRVTIDGSIGGTGTDKSLTLTNFSTSFPSVIVISSLGAGAGASQNTIRNCNIQIGNQNQSGFGISLGGSSPGTPGADNDDVTFQNNSFNAVSTGIYANGTAAISNGGDDNLQIISNTFTTTTSAPECIGIRVGNASGSLIKGNNIDLFSGNAIYPVGISIETGFISSQVIGNLITNVGAFGSNGYGGRGMTIGTGSANSDLTVANNVIYSVRGYDNSDMTKSSMGICIGLLGGSLTTSTTGGIKLYFNSINMYGSATTANAISTAFYAGSSASNLDIRYNIFGNTNTANGSQQKSYGIYSAATNTAFSTINTNDYYVNNPNNPASAIPGFIGTDRINLAAIQSGFGQNVNSIIANPSFNAQYDLRPASGVVLGVANIAGTGITTDYLSVLRSSGLPPDGATIGAYENGIENAAPSIQYTSIQSSCATDDRILVATIADITGVPSTGSLVPRIYFKKNAGAYFSSPGILTSGTGMNGSWTFTITGSTVGGINTGDIISYFVIAQDNSNPIKISSNPSTGLVATSVNNVTTPPSTPNAFQVYYSFGAGIYSVGSTTLSGELGHFPTLTSAIQAYNNACLSGATDFVLTDVSYGGSETFPVIINQNAQASNTNRLTIRPATGISPVISGSTATALIDMNGADYITLNGSNNGTNTKDLTFSNTNTAGAAIRFSNDATNNTIQNTVLKGVSNSTSTGVIYIASTTLTSGNDQLLIQNNDITSGATLPSVCVYNSGNTQSTTLKNSGLQIIGNKISNFSNSGILDNGGSVGTLYQGNEIYQVNAQNVSQLFGFNCNSNTVEGFVFRGNRIYDMKLNNSGLQYGIYINLLSPGQSSTGEISNNMIALDANFGVNSYGITDYTPSGTFLNIYFNTIRISGISGNFSAGYYHNNQSSTDFRNNIISNVKNSSSQTYGMYLGSGISNFITDYNDLNVPNGYTGYLSGNQVTIAQWKAASQQDQHSLNGNLVFLSGTDLHLVANGNCGVDGAGITIAGFQNDFDNQTRSAPPDMGADEFTSTPLPVYSAGPDQMVCTNSAAMAATAGLAGSTGLWSVITGSGSFSSPNFAASFIGNVGSGANTYKWTVTYGTCSTQDTVMITNNAAYITSSPGNIITNPQLPNCSANVDYTVTAIGSPTPQFSYLFWGATEASGSGTGSGSAFNIGLTYVNVIATVGCGYDAVCSFTVEVRAPEVNLLGNGMDISDGQTIPTLTNHTDFDTVLTNANLVRTYTIQNTGTENLSIDSITINGTNASMFSITQPGVSTVLPGQSTSFTVTFAPTSIGLKTATVHVNNSDCNETDYDFAIKGIGDNKYYFIGSGLWTDQSKWLPSYPGLTIETGYEAYMDATFPYINIPFSTTVNINGSLTGIGLIDGDGDIIIGNGGMVHVFGLNVSSTATVDSGGQLIIDGGQLYINGGSGGTFNNAGLLSVINDGTVFNDAYFYNNPGGVIINNGTIDNNAALFENHGTYKGTGTFIGYFGNFPDGTIQPGNSTGCQNYTGHISDFDSNIDTDGTMEFEINGNGNECSDYDKIFGEDEVNLGGTLNIIAGYTPTDGDEVTIIEVETIHETFSTVNAPAGWTVFYNYPTTGKVTLKANCNGAAITGQPIPVQYVCQNATPSTLTVTTTGTGLQYQWYQDDNNNGYDGTPINGATTASYIPSTATAGTYYFYVVVTGICGPLNSSYAAINIDASGRWIGSVSSDWFDAGNWCGGVPTATTGVLILSGVHQPVISGANAVCYSIVLLPGNTLNINAPSQLRVGTQ